MTKTSLALSKKLANGGCKIVTENGWCNAYYNENGVKIHNNFILLDKNIIIANGERVDGRKLKVYCAYDLLWDICIKHAKEFFGEDNFKKGGIVYPSIYHPQSILRFLQQNKIQEAEDYIWEHTIFNPQNK